MQQKQLTSIFLELFAVVAILGALAAVAMPFVGKMINSSKISARAAELHNIQTAVTEMLYDSASGQLVPAGPTADMSLVTTSDVPPLILENYLWHSGGDSEELDSSYIFSSDGKVRQMMP